MATTSVVELWSWLASSHIPFLLGFLFALVTTAKLLGEHRAPGSTIAWLLSFALIPYVGFPLYLILGRRKFPRTGAATGLALAARGRDEPMPEAASLLRSIGIAPPTFGNRARPIFSGREAYDVLLRLIADARRSIDVTMFILSPDAVGDAVCDALCARASAGVRVRVVLDALGGFPARRRLVPRLRAAGADVRLFLPVLPVRRRWSAHLRNHRKITVVDGAAAFVGGRNVADEYMGPTENPNRWADLSLVVRGPAVADLAAVFEADWTFAGGRSDDGRAAAPSERATTTDDDDRADDDVAIQIAVSGPDVEADPLRDALMALIHRAKRRVWIVTPYFIPDEGLTGALALQARRGLDVTLLIPTKSNHAVADLARGTYVRQLRAAGVTVRRFGARMLHLKLVLIDDDVAIVGSANADMRSLYLNYEVACVLHSPAAVRRLAREVEARLFPSSDTNAPSSSRLRVALEEVARLAGPVL